MITKSTVNMIFNFRKIQPSANALVSIFAMGEGWHKYHHTFPWDYKAAELGNYTLNATTFLLDK
jgi:stearoyl-CoA desaturase (delta-9 desaturase)